MNNQSDLTTPIDHPDLISEAQFRGEQVRAANVDISEPIEHPSLLSEATFRGEQFRARMQ